MMRLKNEMALADDLERGLGDVHWLAGAYDQSLRLRLPMCGITSVALTEAFRAVGVDAVAIESSPELTGENDAKHVFVSVDTENGTYIVDPTYSQYLDAVGLSPGYVIFGGEDLFPERKIAVFKFDDGDIIARDLADATAHFREQRQEIDEYLGVHSMETLSHDELIEQFSKIWNPENFDTFIPREPEVTQVGQRLAQFIVPAHVELVA